MEDITLTQEELDAKIKESVDKAVAETKEALKKEHDSQMAQMRISNKAEMEKAVEKAKEQATMSAEDLAKQKTQEELDKKEKEISELRSYKKTTEIISLLTKEKLPLFLANDSRLINAQNADELNDALKLVKKDYTENLPTGSNTSTNVSSQTNNGSKGSDDDFSSFRRLGL